MEENKEKVAAQPEKMTYEQLENVAHQLSEQTKQLYSKLQEANMINMFKRLDYLFKIVEFNDKFNHNFVTKCISEIETIITLPEETTEDKVEE